MATLTIRDVPDELYASLKAGAVRNRRTMSQETIARLERAEPKRRTPRELIALMQRSRRRVPGLWLTPDEVDAAINEGRP
ncbi:MAG TPA: hypothetical protein VFY90_03415 [Tepidiformaceae bacterium]|nr:hypothetical protein [Tepidiformaceae bacterium]